MRFRTLGKDKMNFNSQGSTKSLSYLFEGKLIKVNLAFR
ncbi:hypothetical protein ADICYQ_1646 [Cyclobacterium qasimii M12-11B]|uniref:Uncharacterized protein n=1 Tax=Cyclobacterium qasimii M12-11B TaxID=641524 RepID=S7WRE3_9BACT|nr:hypothetical protein ADICYQ_1646 [Cyclobacterium qasimii M12-11B]